MEAVEKALFFPEPSKAEAFCKQHLDLQEKSRLSRKKYCKINNINYNRFCYWVAKAKNNDDNSILNSSSLIAIKVKKQATILDPAKAICALSLNNGCILKIYSLDVLTFILEKMS